jgi:neutral ceramidase
MDRRSFMTGMAGGTAVGLRGADGPARLRAGAATVNITPALGVSLSGPIMQIGPATYVHDELHARCLALDDGVTRLAIVICDATMISREIFDRAKAIVQQDTGLPLNRMLMAATHSHSVPRVIGISDAELDKEYERFLTRRIADSVRMAIHNLAPARIGWGSGSKPELVSNRRWFMKPGTIPPNPFGERHDRVQMHPPLGSPNRVKPAGPVDPEAFVVSVQHADGRPLALLANYSLHYAGGFVNGHVSADYFGVFAERIKELLAPGWMDPPFVGIMSNGTCGDITAVAAQAGSPPAPPYSLMRELAFELAGEVHRVARQITYRDDVRLAVRESDLELGVRKPDDARLAWARGLWAKAQGKQNLTRSEIHAREAILLSRFPGTVKIRLQTLSVGALAIAAVPCEVFAETGLAIKRADPLKPVFIIELANGYYGYLPTAQQHEWGGYETWPARSSFLQVHAEAKIRAEVLRLLRELREGVR